jgi:hypothetical protein
VDESLDDPKALAADRLLWLVAIRIEELTGIPQEDLREAARRLPQNMGLAPGQSGGYAAAYEGRGRDLRGLLAKLSELDRQGTARRIWQELCEDQLPLMDEAGLFPAVSADPLTATNADREQSELAPSEHTAEPSTAIDRPLPLGSQTPAEGAPRVVQRRPGINARMLDTIQTNTEAMGWSCRQWAEHLKCAKSSVVETPTWKNLAMGRHRERAERARDRRRRPKGSDQRRN